MTKSKAMSIAAWITPADVEQAGPARIVTISSGTNNRNVTLGQDGDTFEVRFRARGTDANGLPGVTGPKGSARPRPTLVVSTRDASGKARLFIDGEEAATRDGSDDLSSWDDSFRLALANETSNDRPWRGTLHLVALFSRALSADEIRGLRLDDAATPPDRSEGGPAGDGLQRYDLAEVPGRGGLLTQGSTLVVGGDEASMVARGLFVLNDLLDSGVGNPPPCVDTTPVPTKPGLTQQSIAMGRINNPSSGGCHSKFEPLAFGLEKFDGVGADHDVDEHGNALRDDGEILFPGAEEPVPYASAAELMDLLADSERVRRTLTRRVAQFALGRPLVAADDPILDRIHAEAREGGGTYASTITAIALSDLVRQARTEPPSEETP